MKTTVCGQVKGHTFSIQLKSNADAIVSEAITIVHRFIDLDIASFSLQTPDTNNF